MEKNSILTICVHYHNEKEVEDFVKEFSAQQRSSEQKIIVIDNSGGLKIAGSSMKSLVSDGRLSIYSPGINMGYYGGAAWGMKRYLKEYPLPDWVIVCNSDIHFTDTAFFDGLLRNHHENTPGVVSPMIISETSGKVRTEHTLKRPSRSWVRFYNWILSHYPTLLIYNILSLMKWHLKDKFKISSNSRERNDSNPFKIYAPAGSFTVFHRSYFEAGGDLNHGAFLYGEEVFVAETARRLNVDVVYDPRLRIIHKGYSTTNIFKSRQILRYKREAVAYYAEAFFKRK